MRWLGSLLVAGLVCAAPWSQARADCGVQGVDTSPSAGWVGAGSPAIRVGPNPTLFSFWRPDLQPDFEARCEGSAEALVVTTEALPSSTDATVARIEVQTAGCSRFVLRTIREGNAYGSREETVYEVDSAWEPRLDRPRPVVLSATRENKMFGCGPSNHLQFETNVRPAALRVEVEPGAHSLVVPLRLYDDAAAPEERGGFWLGRTMCRGPNLPQRELDEPMSVRISALYSDGSTDVGGWQAVRPPPGARSGQDEAAYVVEEPPPPLPSAAVRGATATAEQRSTGWRAWLWFFLAIPGALAVAGSARWVASRRG